MKFKIILSCVVFTLMFIACDDDLSPVGMSVQPDGDRISVYADTIPFTSSTVIVDSVFIKTVTGCLGSFDDPTYGNIKYGYMCNFYSIPDSVFYPDVNKIDSVVLRLPYISYVGDSLTPMEATVYEVTKTLDKNFYSNVDPWKYADKNSVWGKKIYTARDLNIPDSSDEEYKELKITLPTSIGERLYKEWNERGKATFENLESFFDFFPGVYVESTFGSGNILNIEGTYLYVYYNRILERKTTGKKDSVVVNWAVFNSSEEVTQLNKFESKFGNQELVDNPNYTFLKTPAGVVTELKIPLQDIRDKVGVNRTFNNVGLSLEVEEQVHSGDYTLPIPREVLLISPDSVKLFFEKSGSAGNKNSYRTTLSASSDKYEFGNIAPLIQHSIADVDTDTLKLWLVPIETTTTNTSMLSGIVKNYFRPSGAQLKTGKENLKLYITTTEINK